MSDSDSDDSYTKGINDTLARSKFNDDNITIGAAHEWQWAVDEITKFATTNGQSYVIIFTGLVEHNINIPMIELHKIAHEPGDSYAVTIMKLSIIACPITELEQAILDFQQLKIVQELGQCRSCMGPNTRKICSYFEHDGENNEMQVNFSWDS
jgi:hypothetical protein